jgi:hypothetical protein
VSYLHIRLLSSRLDQKKKYPAGFSIVDGKRIENKKKEGKDRLTIYFMDQLW